MKRLSIVFVVVAFLYLVSCHSVNAIKSDAMRESDYHSSVRITEIASLLSHLGFKKIVQDKDYTPNGWKKMVELNRIDPCFILMHYSNFDMDFWIENGSVCLDEEDPIDSEYTKIGKVELWHVAENEKINMKSSSCHFKYGGGKSPDDTREVEVFWGKGHSMSEIQPTVTLHLDYFRESEELISWIVHLNLATIMCCERGNMGCTESIREYDKGYKVWVAVDCPKKEAECTYSLLMASERPLKPSQFFRGNGLKGTVK